MFQLKLKLRRQTNSVRIYLPLEEAASEILGIARDRNDIPLLHIATTNYYISVEIRTEEIKSNTKLAKECSAIQLKKPRLLQGKHKYMITRRVIH
jgi:hypothetical protein